MILEWSFSADTYICAIVLELKLTDHSVSFLLFLQFELQKLLLFHWQDNTFGFKLFYKLEVLVWHCIYGFALCPGYM